MAARQALNLTLGTWRSILVGASILLPFSICLWLTIQVYAAERRVDEDLSRVASTAVEEGNPGLARALEDVKRSEEAESGGLRRVALALARVSEIGAGRHAGGD